MNSSTFQNSHIAKRVAIFLMALFFLACAQVGVTSFRVAEPKEANCHLEVFTSEAQVGRAFEVLCLVESMTGQGAFAERTAKAAIELARPELCRCGSDAAILLEANSAKAGWFTTNEQTPTQDLRGNAKFHGIRFVD